MEHQDNRPVMVSIMCLTYKKAPYLDDCLTSFVSQKTNFRYEAIVHDDASNDGSAEIIMKYARRYPDIIRPVIETENTYSKHDGSLDRATYPLVRGKYTAYCEGDDYWTDPTKLQRQVDFLESHPEYVAVAENGIEYNINTQKRILYSSLHEQDITITQLATRNSFPTASVMFRSSALTPAFYALPNHFDTTVWCYLATLGKFRFLENVSVLYRRGSGVTATDDLYAWSQTAESIHRGIIETFGKYYDTSISLRAIEDQYRSAVRVYIWHLHFCSGLRKSIARTMQDNKPKAVLNIIKSFALMPVYQAYLVFQRFRHLFGRK
jgi:glycosyltransferase involved in cell wall biosynthesis